MHNFESGHITTQNLFNFVNSIVTKIYQRNNIVRNSGLSVIKFYNKINMEQSLLSFNYFKTSKTF